MNNPKISIVIPVYNVEKYLCRCVDSVLNQTYKNIEVVLVDDGSPDGCPIICDEYAQKDNRVKVIHKPNGGLSSARNAGLDSKLEGTYVTFIDSDDWIEQDTFEYSIGLLEKYDAQAVQYDMCLTDRFDKQIKQPSEGISTYEGKDVVQYYMRHSTEDSGEYSVCIGLYHKSLFDQLRFRVGRVNEDIDFKYKLMSRCERLVVSNQIKYNYFQANNSISTGGLEIRDFQLREAGNLLAELTKDESYGDIAFLGKVKQARTAFSLLSKIAYFGVSDASLDKKQVVRELTAEHRKNLGILLKSPMSLSRKLLAILFAISYTMTECAVKIVKSL